MNTEENPDVEPAVHNGIITVRENPMENVDFVIEDDVGNLFPLNIDEVEQLIEAVEEAREVL